MPYEIEHIDAIARAKKRDVLYIDFHKNIRDQVNWKSLPLRQQIIDWFDANAIEWRPCAHAGSTQIMMSYKGQIYIDLAFNETDPRYQKVCAYLENPDGTMAFDGATFRYYPLSLAMENAHHDEPGFWEKWAENF
jgi:hypothetical protein